MKTIDLHSLQNAEHLALMRDLLAVLKEANIEALIPLKEKFVQQVDLEESAQKQITKSGYTATLVELDQSRDEIFRGLVLRVQSELLTQDENRRKSAQQIKIVIDTYGNFTQHNLQKETIEIENLLQDLKSERYTSLSTDIGLNDWIGWLEEANNKFETTYTSRRDEYANRPDLNLKSIRNQSDILFKELCKMTAALEVLQPSESLHELISKADTSISKWRDILSQRRADGKKKKNSDTE